MSVKNIFSKCWHNLFIRNLLIFIVVAIGLVAGLLLWMDVYTMHNQAILVPDVKGFQIEEAGPIIERASLRYVVIDSVYSKETAPGAIVEQLPEASSKVKKNRIVYLTLNAKGQQTTELPEVKDLSQRQAVATLRSKGFVVDRIEYIPYEFPDAVAEMQYAGKEVHGGLRLPVGSKIVLLVGENLHAAKADSAKVDSLEEQEIIIQDTGKGWFE